MIRFVGTPFHITIAIRARVIITGVIAMIVETDPATMIATIGVVVPVTGAE